MQDAQDLDDARFDEMDEEMGVGMGSQYEGENEDDGPHGAPPVLGGVALGSLSGADARTAGYGGYEAPEQHDDHGDLVRRLGLNSLRLLAFTDAVSLPAAGWTIPRDFPKGDWHHATTACPPQERDPDRPLYPEGTARPQVVSQRALHPSDSARR